MTAEGPIGDNDAEEDEEEEEEEESEDNLWRQACVKSTAWWKTSF